MKKLSIALLIALFGCEKAPVSVSQTDNQHIALDKLFSVDGCNVYRFQDEGRPVYVTTCEGRTEYKYKSGKTTYTQTSLTAKR